MRIYISGPITNVLDYKEKFERAEQNLKAKYPDAEIINPTILDKLPLEYDEYMKLDLMLLDMCDAIYMLDGWEESRGANREYGYAIAKGKKVIFESEGDLHEE